MERQRRKLTGAYELQIVTSKTLEKVLNNPIYCQYKKEGKSLDVLPMENLGELRKRQE